MKLRFLGTGTSYGVPVVGCSCKVCMSLNPRDKRLRASILIEDERGDGEILRLLVDTGPDFRTQMLQAEVDRLDAVLWTHLHNDHIIGLDDIRPLTDRQGYIPGYGNGETMERLMTIFEYIFIQNRDHGGFPRVTPHVIQPGTIIDFGSVQVRPLSIFHGQRSIFAYEFTQGEKRIVYATDCSGIPDESLDAMWGCDIFIVDALRHAVHPTHFNIAQALGAIAEIKPKRAFFTHITHDLGHVETEAELPPHVRMSYDGLELTL